MHNIPGFNSRFSSVAAAIVTRAANKKASLEKVAQGVLPPGFNLVGLYNKLSPELKQFGHTLTDPQQSVVKKFLGMDPAITIAERGLNPKLNLLVPNQAVSQHVNDRVAGDRLRDYMSNLWHSKVAPELTDMGNTIVDPKQSLLKKFFGLDPAIPRRLTNSSPVNMKGYADNFLDDLSGKIQTGFQPNYNHSDFLIRPSIPVPPPPPPPPSVFSRAMSHAGAGALAATGTGVAAFGTQKAYQGLSNRYGQQAANRLY
jgi:hypothetical protein